MRHYEFTKLRLPWDGWIALTSRPPVDESLRFVNLNDLSLADDEILEINSDADPFAQSDEG